jgi:hypothetical protein
MSTAAPRLPPSIGTHPAVLDRRLRSAGMVAVAALVPLLVSLAITVALPKPSLAAFVLGFVGILAVLALMLSDRLEITVGLVLLYLGLVDGPLKLGVGGGGEEVFSGVRNALIGAVALGALLRVVVKKERIRIPALGGWVVAFVTFVAIEAFNPKTEGILKVLGGYRQQLQWVPFFFFAYVLLRSKASLRKFFIILGVIALANAAVATYQTQIGTSQLAGWGPGYKLRVEGFEEQLANGTVVHRGARKFGGTNGEAGGIRPMGLGADAGFGAGVGLVALPCMLALVATGRGRRRWIGVPLALGAIVGVGTGLGRIQLVGAVVAIAGFLALASAAHRMRPVVLTVLGVAILAIPLGAVFVSAAGSSMFARYEKLLEASPTGKCEDCKKGNLSTIPHEVSVAPLGLGLGAVGSVSALGGKNTQLVEGHGVSSDTQYNFVTNELGLPGLIFWIAFPVMVVAFVVRRLPRVKDTDLRICLAAVFAPFIAIAIIGVSGPTYASAVLGPWFWLAPGLAAYWLGKRTTAPAVASRQQVPVAA